MAYGDKLTCKKCQWEWRTRQDKMPARCPHCNQDWTKERIKEKATHD